MCAHMCVGDLVGAQCSVIQRDPPRRMLGRKPQSHAREQAGTFKTVATQIYITQKIQGSLKC